jgi:hypothetical protein
MLRFLISLPVNLDFMNVINHKKIFHNIHCLDKQPVSDEDLLSAHLIPAENWSSPCDSYSIHRGSVKLNGWSSAGSAAAISGAVEGHIMMACLMQHRILSGLYCHFIIRTARACSSTPTNSKSGGTTYKTGKRPLGRQMRRWEDNIRMELREMRWEGVGGLDSSGSGRDRWRAVVNTGLNLRSP